MMKLHQLSYITWCLIIKVADVIFQVFMEMVSQLKFECCLFLINVTTWANFFGSGCFLWPQYQTTSNIDMRKQKQMNSHKSHSMMMMMMWFRTRSSLAQASNFSSFFSVRVLFAVCREVLSRVTKQGHGKVRRSSGKESWGKDVPREESLGSTRKLVSSHL